MTTLPDWDDDDTPIDPQAELRALLINWPDFWAKDHGEVDWLVEPILAAKRSTAMFAPGGVGKSLLALWMCAQLATGGTAFGRRLRQVDVLYLDYEMTEDDLAERLEAMGFGGADLTRLHYALLPSLPGLDEPEGGKAVVELARMVDAELVVIDTFGRAVHGDENEADTVRAWYRWTGLHLKAEGRAFNRIDHAGKDIAKGQRGTSAKNDDVDVVWQMTRGDGDTFKLTAKKRRMGWVPEIVDLVRHEDPHMRYELLNGRSWPSGTSDAVADLEDLGIPADAPVRASSQALRDAGKKYAQAVITSAVKFRKEALLDAFLPVDNSPQSVTEKSRNARAEDTPVTRSVTQSADTALPQVDDLRNAARNASNAVGPDRCVTAAIYSGNAPGLAENLDHWGEF
jgi:hypothetical protein